MKANESKYGLTHTHAVAGTRKRTLDTLVQNDRITTQSNSPNVSVQYFGQSRTTIRLLFEKDIAQNNLSMQNKYPISI